MAIHLLKDELISQIAAGEVVERPASVVKELIENAIDAQAAAISIQIEDAGLRLIEVADDGKGISYEEIELAITRHATSKLESADDLYHIATLGFRGEALASIASVSRTKVISREGAVEMGGELWVDGGKKADMKAVGAPQGTLIRVEDLFYNVPPRLAFLKTPATEKSRINELVFRYALAYPDIRWQLFQDHRPILRTTGNGDRREIMANIYGPSISRELIEVNLNEDATRVFGFISPMAITRSNRHDITFFVNGRWVMDTGLSAALMQAYAHLLPPKRFPVAILFIQIDPQMVDVNVHPSKAEVRFRDNGLVFSTVQRAVRRAFMAYTPISEPQVLQNPQGIANQNRLWSGLAPARTIDPAWTMAGILNQDNQNSDTSVPDQEDESLSPVYIQKGMDLLEFIGEMRRRYILAEGPDGLYLIDEFAAKETIVYEDFLMALSTGSLLTCETSLTMHTCGDDISGWFPALEVMGFSFENFGPSAVRVRQFPVLLGDVDQGLFMGKVCESIRSQKSLSFEENSEWLLKEISFLCGAQYQSNGDPASLKALLSRLQMCRSPRLTPNGQAVMIHLSMDSLYKQFGYD